MNGTRKCAYDLSHDVTTTHQREKKTGGGERGNVLDDLERNAEKAEKDSACVDDEFYQLTFILWRGTRRNRRTS
jgi:hypothetical protein